MAINTNSGDSSACSSPRLSFSHDLPDNNNNTNPTQTDEDNHHQVIDLKNHPSSDFMFCVPGAQNGQLTSPADELFFNGVIIPTQMRDKINNSNDNKQEHQEITSTTTATLVREEKIQSKSFWRFRRSSSLNCDTTSRKSSIWSLPGLLRSKSTGSTATNKAVSTTTTSKSLRSSSQNSTNSSLPPPHNRHHQKSSMLKNTSGAHTNSYYTNHNNNNNNSVNHSNNHNNYNSVNSCYVRNSPVLNVPPPYIAKGTSDLLGLGGWFRNNNGSSKLDKKSRKS